MDQSSQAVPLLAAPSRQLGAVVRGAVVRGARTAQGMTLVELGRRTGYSAAQVSLEPPQYTSVRFTETLMLEGLTPSVGTVGDAYDNALAETTIGLYKTECIRAGSPFRHGPIRSLADLEEITSAWVHWYNTARLMHRLGRRPPAEAEAGYCQQAKDAA